MSPRPMRRYTPGSVLCDGCHKPIVVSRQEYVMRAGAIYHVLCVPKVAA